LLVAGLALAIAAAGFVGIGLVSARGLHAFLAAAVSSGGSLLLLGIGAGRTAGPVRPSKRSP
jgi:hypothetical protein